MATIYDVAKAAGVSPKTVSRVLNRDAPVGAKTREKVEGAIATLGYVPSSAARMMRSNKSGLVGLITGAISGTPDPQDPTGLPDLYIVQGVQKALAAAGKTLLISDTGGDAGAVPHLLRTFAEHRVEGVIYVADYHRPVDFDSSTAGCPVVLANCYDACGTPAVLPDDRAGQRDLVLRLIGEGHRRIGYLTLDPAMDAARLRSDGYRDALEQAGIGFDPDLIRVGYTQVFDNLGQALRNSLDALLALPNPPTVICAGNDEMALRLYGLLRTRGLRVPEDMSVAGFDDYRVIAETLYPPLTTCTLNYPEIGRAAAGRLLALMADPNTRFEGTPELVSGPVVWRSSVTAASAVGHRNPLGGEP